jgi:hypothetical protein
MRVTRVKSIILPGSPRCERCGGEVRLFGIEPHPTRTRADLRSYVCTQCDAMRIESVPLRPRLLAMTETVVPMPGLAADAAFDAETTKLLGAAFEAAWQTVETSGSGYADAPHAAATRELLAKRIVERAKQGERDHGRLVEDALDHLLQAKAA